MDQVVELKMRIIFVILVRFIVETVSLFDFATFH